MFACHPFIDHIQASLSHALLPPANEVWGKVIFLHLSVILFTGGVSCPGGGEGSGPGGGEGGYSYGWYASYRNTFLFRSFIFINASIRFGEFRSKVISYMFVKKVFE